jgi:hypothetical protein
MTRKPMPAMPDQLLALKSAVVEPAVRPGVGMACVASIDIRHLSDREDVMVSKSCATPVSPLTA